MFDSEAQRLKVTGFEPKVTGPCNWAVIKENFKSLVVSTVHWVAAVGGVCGPVAESFMSFVTPLPADVASDMTVVPSAHGS